MHHIKNVTVIMRMYCVSFRLASSENIQEKEQIEQNKLDNGVDKLVKKQKI